MRRLNRALRRLLRSQQLRGTTCCPQRFTYQFHRVHRGSLYSVRWGYPTTRAPLHCRSVPESTSLQDCDQRLNQTRYDVSGRLEEKP